MNSFTAQSYFGGSKPDEEVEEQQQGKQRKYTRKNDRLAKLCKFIGPD